MRVVVQRVAAARVDVQGKGEVAAIQRGICVLVGVARRDTEQDAEFV